MIERSGRSMHPPRSAARAARSTIAWGWSLSLCVAAAIGAGCSGSGPRIPEPPGSVIEQVLHWEQAAGSEIVKCHTFKLGTDVPVNVRRVQFVFGTGSHHVHIYRSDEPEADTVDDCEGGLTWPRWQLMVSAQTEPLDWRLPDGLTVPVAAHQQMLVQVHWLNPTTKPVSGEIKLRFSTADDPGTPVGTLFGINKRVAIAPGERRVLTQSCPLPEQTNILALMGHFHALGRRYEASLLAPDGAATTIYTGADEGTLELTSYDPPLAAPPGTSLEFSCDMVNRRDVPARWGPDTNRDEHCNVVAYYYPASQDASACIRDFASAGQLAGVEVPGEVPWAGATVPVTVRLAAQSSDDTLVELLSQDASALDLPPFVIVPAGEVTATVSARAVRPTRGVAVTASLLGTRLSTGLSVRGLVLSEVMAWPSDGSGETWIEIANLGTTPLDLGRYALATGGASSGSGYRASGPLSGILQPLGCAVLPLALGKGSGGDGVALVELGPVNASTATTPPVAGVLDALVYGDANRQALPDASGQIATPIPAMTDGQSISRRDSRTWQGQLVPTPSVCEVIR